MKFVIKKKEENKKKELPTSHMYNKLTAFTNTTGSTK